MWKPAQVYLIGVVRQSLTHPKVPRSHKPMKRRFGTTPWEQLYVFAYKSVCFEDVFHDWSGCWYLLNISNPYQ